MNEVERTIILNSCKEADEILAFAVSDNEVNLQLEAVQFSEIFRKAADPQGLKVNETSLRTAINQTFFLTSTDMLSFQNRCPVVWNGLNALRPAAAQLNKEYF